MGNTFRVVIDGVGLEVRRWPGNGVPILLLHGALSSVSTWRDFPERLVAATGREVIAWSRRSYGGSDPLIELRDVNYVHAEADAIPPLLDALGVKQAHFYGFSDGASIALVAGAHSPDRVASLVLEAPHVMVEEIAIDGIAALRTEYETTDYKQKLSRHHADVEHAFWNWNNVWLDPDFRSWSIEGLLPAIQAPTLLMQGVDDEYGTMDQIDRIATVLPFTQRLELQDCRHGCHREQPETVLNAVAAFLSQRQ